MRSPGAIAVDLWKARILVAQLEREKEAAEAEQLRTIYAFSDKGVSGYIVPAGVQLPRECEDQ